MSHFYVTHLLSIGNINEGEKSVVNLVVKKVLENGKLKISIKQFIFIHSDGGKLASLYLYTAMHNVLVHTLRTMNTIYLVSCM